MTFQNLNSNAIRRIPADESKVDRIIESIDSQSWDCILLPSFFAIDCVRKKWLEMRGMGLLPKMITYDHPLGYAHSSTLPETPISLGHGLAWSLHFFQTHFSDAIHQGDRDLTGLARALMQLWEHIEYTRLYGWHGQNNAENDSMDIATIPESLRAGLVECGTPYLIHEWLKWWPQWLQKKGWCSHTRSCFLAQKQALAWWRTHPEHRILCWIHAGEKTPWSWLGDLSHLPNFYALQEDSSTPTDIPPPLAIETGKSRDHPIAVQSIACQTTEEQGRVIALLIRETLHQPNASVGLIVSSTNLLRHISQVLKQYRISLAIPKMPLINSLLHTIWQGSVAGWGRAEILTLLRQPLILKKYPIADAMAQWIERYTSDWTPERIKKWDAMPRKPRWLSRLQRMLWNAVGTLTRAIQESLATSVPHTGIFWIDQHIQALQALVPSTYWDHAGIIEKMWQERLNLLPTMDVMRYGYWIRAFSETILHTTETNHDRLYVGTADDMHFLAPHRCIISLSPAGPLFPWMPKSWSAHFQIPEQKDDIILPNIHHQGDCWLMSHQSTPTVSVYRDWARHSLHSAHPPLHAADKPTPTRHKPPIRPYPPIHVLSISDLQRWHTDPEAFYQERVLRIRSHQTSPQQLWGIAMHTLLHHFIQDFPPQGRFSMAEMLDGLQQLAGLFLPPMPWFQHRMRDQLLHQIVQCEMTHRETGVYQSRTEQSGKMTFSLKNGSVSLVGRADRIDYLHDGTAHVMDYKTGTVPSFVALDRMESVQLPLEGLMVQSGSMGQSMPVSKISWWSLHWTKGCQIRTYPRCVEKLLDRYALALPNWLNQLAGGDYKNIPDKGSF